MSLQIFSNLDMSAAAVRMEEPSSILMEVLVVVLEWCEWWPVGDVVRTFAKRTTRVTADTVNMGDDD